MLPVARTLLLSCLGAAVLATAGEPAPAPANPAASTPVTITNADLPPAEKFEKEVRPVLMRLCGDCHNKDKDVPFMKAVKLDEMNNVRWAWRSVVSQLRNRTMPPADETQPTEAERMAIADWLDKTLRSSAATMGDFAGAPVSRRLNRLEYDNTIRDLIGLELNFSETFPTEGGGGEGFTNNGETLFLPVILMERYLEAGQQILDLAIISPPLNQSFAPNDFAAVSGTFTDGRIAKDSEAALQVSILVTGDYEISLAAKTEDNSEAELSLKVDGITAGRFKATGADKPLTAQLRFQRGVHTLSLKGENGTARVSSLALSEKQPKLTDAKRAAHKRIFGELDSAAINAQPSEARQSAAQQIVGNFARKAFRRPLNDGELQRFMGLYARSAERKEPFEESVKLALKAVLVSPHFLFRAEKESGTPGIHALSEYELASRLSYFLWASMPDEELMKLADEKKLGQPDVLAAQVDRMLNDPKSRSFFADFTGQWLGTKEVGASVAFTAEKFKGIYTNELAAELREEPIQLLQYILKENRSLLELIDSNYVFVTARTAKHYGFEGLNLGEIKTAKWNDPLLPVSAYHRIEVKDGRRGGVMGLGAVHMVTSYPDRTSPVLRGAWVLETMLGVRVPAPPPDIPTLEAAKRKQKDATMRQVLEKHREVATCAACHNLIDPIGFGLENFDLLGRWRDMDGKSVVDATGVMPSGEKFNGPAELKRILLNRKDEFSHHFCGKMLGYALGRSLEDRDDYTIEKLSEALKKDNFHARTLIREIVLSTPFRNRQGGEPARKNTTQHKKKALPAAKPL